MALQILKPDAVLQRLDALSREAVELMRRVSAAAEDNERRDRTRVNPEGRTRRRARAHDRKR